MIKKSKSFPWHHYELQNFFPNDLLKVLQDEQLNDADYSEITGFRDVIKGRTFLGNQYVEDNPHLKPVAEFLNQKDFFEEQFKVDLQGKLLRAELIWDRYPFFHDVHIDLPCKNLTMILNICKEDEQNLSTDLYLTKDIHVKKLDWHDNGGVAFKITDKKWHGFSPIEYKGIRKIMIINYVNHDEWRDKEQCFY
tara:strand:+ start:6293 stop:6874 length:582 start_codon:yes stop_codon:yes gene_type:complete